MERACELYKSLIKNIRACALMCAYRTIDALNGGVPPGYRARARARAAKRSMAATGTAAEEHVGALAPTEVKMK